MFITQGKTNWKFLFILAIFAVFVGGIMVGAFEIMRCPYFWPSSWQKSDSVLLKNLGKEFVLGFGQTAVIKSEDLKVQFSDVLADSRCPSDVQCIWAGEVKVSLSIHKNDQKNLGIYEFTSQAGILAVQNIEGYSVKLVSVNPYPISTKTIEKPEYNLTLLVLREEEICKNQCGDGVCQEIVCQAVGCPCSETKVSCPQDCGAQASDKEKACVNSGGTVTTSLC